MTPVGTPSQAPHAVQLYERQEFLQRSVTAFFSEGASDGGPMIVVSRQETFQGICRSLAQAFGCTPAEAAARVTFIDAHALLRELMVDGLPDPERFEHLASSVLTAVRQNCPRGTIRLFGEAVDVLCAEGNYAAAIRFEELWNTRFGKKGVSVLCGYAISRFDEDERGRRLRAVCREHTLVIPTEEFSEVIDERSRLEHVALLQQRARQLAKQPGLASGASVPMTTALICLIEDDPSVRRSLSRLIDSAGLRVKAYASAEAFLAAVNEIPIGCIIADVQLTGMSGLELQTRLQGTGWPMILTSGSYNPQVESDALRQGARAFLRKPFQAQELFGAIRRALHSGDGRTPRPHCICSKATPQTSPSFARWSFNLSRFTPPSRAAWGSGLPLCLTLVHAQGGTLSAVRNPDAGLTFSARFPLHGPDVSADARS